MCWRSLRPKPLSRPRLPPRCTWKPSTGTVAVVDHLALEPDVGDLDARARVRAAVDVDRDRHVELGVDVLEPLLQFGDQHLRAACGSRRTTACRTRCRCRPSGSCASATATTAARVRRARATSSSSLSSAHVEDDQLLVRREPDPVGTRGLGEVGDLGQDGAGHPARDGGDADGVEPVLQLLHADVVDRARHRLGRRARRSAAASGTRPRGPRGTSRRPSP